MSACSITVRGVVQGVGFRPFVFRLAQANTLAGWVLNGEQGLEIFVEGNEPNLEAFVQGLRSAPPPAAQIAEIEIRTTEPVGFRDFTIRDSRRQAQPTTRISPDLPVCEQCLAELFDPTNHRYQYPYINCTYCGPRYSVTQRLPYDRENTTMNSWSLDDFCGQEYHDPSNRRFHAQPVACTSCGPGYYLLAGSKVTRGSENSIQKAAELLREGKIVAVKGIGGYHLACEAKNRAAVSALRERKFRKEKPFALMVRNLATAREVVELTGEAEELLNSTARPIVIVPAKGNFPEVAPGIHELGVMLPYTPLHHLLFDTGAPEILVMTSANRSSEPIAYDDVDALNRLSSIADAFLIGERPIARRLDDSVARMGAFGPVILRRSRGYAPGAVTNIPTSRPILAFGADLKNTVTLVVDGQAFVCQHIGDLSDYHSFRAFQQTVDDLLSMYEVDRKDVLVAHDAHPQYLSTLHAENFQSSERVGVQHHRAHIASVLAEQRAWTKPVVGVSFDGTGYGDDGTIWGGEIFIGSINDGFDRVAHLRPALLAGGDAASQYPIQAAAGFLTQLDNLPNLSAPPFSFTARYAEAEKLIHKGVRTFATTSMGRLFDAAAALLGFTRDVTFEGQAAIWLEQLAREAQLKGDLPGAYEFPFESGELDFRPLLNGVLSARLKRAAPAEIARGFQRGIAVGLFDAVRQICKSHELDTVVLSGGVFQNEMLLEDLRELLDGSSLTLWTNHAVPTNDGGISLGQAAIAAFRSVNTPIASVPHA